MSDIDTSETIGLRMTRQLPATPEEVFDAYTDAEKQKIWYSILDEEPGVVEIEVDLRVGGRQVAVWGPNRDTLFREEQTFVEIDRPHRLVTTEKVGRVRQVRLGTERLDDAMAWISFYQRLWERRLDGLEAYFTLRNGASDGTKGTES